MEALSLSRAEMQSLRDLTLGSVRRRINSAHAVRLVELGLARETADGVVLTQRGRARLAANGGESERFTLERPRFEGRV